ncbi:hypothetical protein ACFX13_016588 [Malus domestica]
MASPSETVFLIVALCSFVTGYLFRHFQIKRAPVEAAPQDMAEPQVQGHVPAMGENRAPGEAAAQGMAVEDPLVQDHVPAIRQPLLGENPVPAPAIENQNAVGMQELQQEGQEPANGARGQPVIQGDGNNMGDEVSSISPCNLLVNVLSAIMLPISILTCPWARKELGKTTTFNGFLIFLVVVVGVGLVDGYALYLIDKYKQILVIHQQRIHLGIVRDIIDVCLLGLGLFIQQQVDKNCGLWCLWILGSFFGLFISFIWITKPTTVLGFADFIIGILAVLLVFLAKTKIGTGGFTILQQLSLMITSSLAIVLALFYRNHYEQVMGGNVNPITCYGWLSARVRAIWNAANGNEANDNNAV